MTEQRVGCVILGAGAGTRYGEPKAGAEVSMGVRFVDQIVATAREGGIADIVAVMHPDVLPPADVRSIVNPRPTSQQIVSLRLGLAQLVNVPVTGALVWPVDHPHVTTSTITALLEFIRNRAPLIARPAFEGKHGHPVYFSRDIWRELVTVADGGAREVVHKNAAEAHEIAVDDRGVIRDMNTKSD